MFTFPSGTIVPTALEITVPTPALVNTAPREAKSMGNILNGPTVPSISAASSKNVLGRLSREKNIKISIAAKTPTPTPTKAPKLVNKANKIAKTPILKAGINIFIPSLSDIFSIYAFDGSRLSPLLTLLAIAGMVIAKIKPPFTIAGSHLPPAITTPKTVQKKAEP